MTADEGDRAPDPPDEGDRAPSGSDEAGDEPAADDGDDPGEREDHLADVPDGCGCAEVWEYLSERREAER